MYLLFTNKKNLMMENEFVSYEQAVALKKLGFDEDCFAGYDTFGDLWIGYNSTDGIEYNPSYYNKAPLKQQVFRWFREKYDLLGYVEKLICGSFEDVISSPHLLDWEDDITYLTYEEAEENCINRLIEIAKQQDNGK